MVRARRIALIVIGVLDVLVTFSVASEMSPSQFTGTVPDPARISQPTALAGAVQHSTTNVANLWGLTIEEWKRYEFLKQGIRGTIAPDSSPIEVLGISARNPEERERYAERWAQMLHDDTANVLAFQRAYTKAWDRLGFSKTLFNRSLAPVASSPVPEIQQQDRLLFFAAPNKPCPRCKALLTRGLELIEQRRIRRLDIYLLDQANDKAIIRWARDQGINPDLVKGRLVTLNHDKGTLSRLAPHAKQMPVLLRKRGVAFAAIDPRAIQ